MTSLQGITPIEHVTSFSDTGSSNKQSIQNDTTRTYIKNVFANIKDSHSGVRPFPRIKGSVSTAKRSNTLLDILQIKQRKPKVNFPEEGIIHDILSLRPRIAAGSSLTFEDPWKGRSNVTRKTLTIDDYQKLADSLTLKDAYTSFKCICKDSFQNILRQICIYICIRFEYMGEPEDCRSLKVLEHGSIIADNFKELSKPNKQAIKKLLSNPSRVPNTEEEDRALVLLGMFEFDRNKKIRKEL